MGWSLEIARRVIRGNIQPLPEVDFGANFIDGLKMFVVGFVYSLPIILMVVPLMLLTTPTSTTINGNQEVMTGASALVGLCCGGLIMLYALLMAFVMPAAYGRLAATGDLGAAFRLNDVIGLVRANPGAYLLVLLGALITGAVIAPLGGILCGVGVVLTSAYALAINGHLYGQAYNEASGNRELSAAPAGGW
jgi:hypothetical protein